MSMDIMARLDWALTAGNLTQGARLTLIRLCRAADRDTVVRSISEFARTGRMHRRCVQRHLDQMVRCGLVRVDGVNGSQHGGIIHILFGGRK